jgi:hypothetical protein
MAGKLSDKGPKLSDKGPKLSDKGPKLSDKGAAAGMVEDLFRSVSGLGGVIVIAVVAPVPSVSRTAGNGRNNRREAAASALAQKVRTLDRQDADKVREEADRNRAILAELASHLKAGRLQLKR